MLVLLRPFSFLAIRHPSNLPMWVNWVLPFTATGVSLLFLHWLGPDVNVFGSQGLLDRLLAFVQTLAGFYIAALAAVSSFNSPHLDREMPAPAPTMYIMYNERMQLVPATRRRFLASMFAYLTSLSFLFSLAAIATTVLAPVFKQTWPHTVSYLHCVGAGFFLMALFQMTCVTFWGLFYLGERMITPD
jgi:hypothetical protein